LTERKENILIVAGEVSGDIHGAEVLKELRKTNPHLQAFGIGGDELIKNGLTALYHINNMAFMGFAEVIRHLPFIAKVKRELAALVKEKNITTAILIDYPGFNLNFARLLKKMNVKIIYYISPQLWAWGKGRISKIKKLVNTMLVVFPFEETMYRGYGIKAEFVGHPLVEQIDAYHVINRQELYAKYGLKEDKDILLVLPGSREQEVRLIYPAIAEGVEKLAKKYDMQIVLACAPLIDSAVFEQLYKAQCLTRLFTSMYTSLCSMQSSVS
jgi:lipid-A-disaccharide synthase